MITAESPAVLAFDRVARCHRVVSAQECEIVDAYGEPAHPCILAADVAAGWIDVEETVDGRPETRRIYKRGMQVVVAHRVAEQLAKGER